MIETMNEGLILNFLWTLKKLGSGRTVYFGLMVKDGREVAVRKLKTKQLPQLQPNLIRSMLALRHPNLLQYNQFCILKVTFDQFWRSKKF